MRSRGRRERRRNRSRSDRSKRGWRRGGDRRPRERGQQGRTGEAGGTERRLQLQLEVAPKPAVPGSLAVEGGETGRGRRRTSGGLRVAAAQTERRDVVTLPGEALPGVAPLHPRRAVAPGGGRLPKGPTGHHQGVMGEADKEPGDRAAVLEVAAEISGREDLLPGGMVVMPLRNALLTAMFGGEVDLGEEEEVRIGLLPEEVDVIVTLVLEEVVVVIATLVPEMPLLPAVTTDPPTGVVVESGAPRPEMRNPERDQLENQRTAGPKSSVDLFPLRTLIGENFFLRWNPTLNVLKFSSLPRLPV